jgi:hypothetical protein
METVQSQAPPEGFVLKVGAHAYCLHQTMAFACMHAWAALPSLLPESMQALMCSSAKNTADASSLLPCTAQAFDNGDRQALKYAAACAHGECLLDRIARVQWFLAVHGGCDPRWAPLQQQPRESPQQHAARLAPLFTFERQPDTPVVHVQRRTFTPGGACMALFRLSTHDMTRPWCS